MEVGEWEFTVFRLYTITSIAVIYLCTWIFALRAFKKKEHKFTLIYRGGNDAIYGISKILYEAITFTMLKRRKKKQLSIQLSLCWINILSHKLWTVWLTVSCRLIAKTCLALLFLSFCLFITETHKHRTISIVVPANGKHFDELIFHFRYKRKWFSNQDGMKFSFWEGSHPPSTTMLFI